MKLLGAAHQTRSDDYFDASGLITTLNTAQLVLPVRISCSLLFIQNNSAVNMAFAFGGARATCTINAAGQVNTVTVTNGGFGYTYPPHVWFYGGGSGNPPNPTYLSAGLVDYPSPSQPAQATAALTGAPGAAVVSSITIDNPGAFYVRAPQVFLRNDASDPFGVMTPSLSAPSTPGQGSVILQAGGSYVVNGTDCPTSAISVICGTTGAQYTCHWMD